MSAHKHSASSRPKLKDRLRAISWFWLLFSSIVGAPSWLSIFQQVTKHGNLTAFQWIVDGYNSLVNELAKWIEPILLPAIKFAAKIVDIELQLHGHWRPIFLLMLLPIIAEARHQWRNPHGVNPKYPERHTSASIVIVTTAQAVWCLVRSTAAGLVPLNEVWWSPVGVVGAVVILTSLGESVVKSLRTIMGRGTLRIRLSIIGENVAEDALLSLLLLIAMAALCYFVPVIGGYAAFIPFIAFIMIRAVFNIRDRYYRELGLLETGGLATALIIFGVDTWLSVAR